MLDSFQYFESLPTELQMEIWSFAVRPTSPGVQIFSLVSYHRSTPHEYRGLEAHQVATYHLEAPKWAFGSGHNFNAFDGPTASWTKNNPSTYLVDSGLSRACRRSNHAIRHKLGSINPVVIPTRVRSVGLNIEASTLEKFALQQRSIIVSPSQDLFILQLDDPDMFNWSLVDDAIPNNMDPNQIHIRHVGWQYHPIWASSLHESPWIGSLDSLCCYMIYGARFRGLETLWLINYRIKRKHWVPKQKELDRAAPKVFETTKFRLVEVLADEEERLDESSTQLQWNEATNDETAYAFEDFLAFVYQLRRLVSHSLLSTLTLPTAKPKLSIKILAYEDR
ncbi:uncharacterized protein FTOL_12368 [Fusarium torulosum]|uniref:2EXR domain-containing protein n=1 Tax=Fusarium torulosum TaxID=33205 RepID=A0AAE8MM82_9HYPO|nr:uncharacterized protein FTOL_12368 [Fusarium torulosum]